MKTYLERANEYIQCFDKITGSIPDSIRWFALHLDREAGKEECGLLLTVTDLDTHEVSEAICRVKKPCHIHATGFHCEDCKNFKMVGFCFPCVWRRVDRIEARKGEPQVTWNPEVCQEARCLWGVCIHPESPLYKPTAFTPPLPPIEELAVPLDGFLTPDSILLIRNKLREIIARLNKLTETK